jgi:hypothetical protein
MERGQPLGLLPFEQKCVFYSIDKADSSKNIEIYQWTKLLYKTGLKLDSTI